MNDTIYRCQAIDTMQMFIDSLDKESPAYKSLSIAFDRCIIELKRMPSAEPIISKMEKVGDTISRQTAIDEIMSLIEEPDDDFNEGVRNSAVVIYNLPSAQPQRKKGKWIYHSNWEVDGECGYECSECGMGSDVDYNYCMRCGARMVKEGEEHD